MKKILFILIIVNIILFFGCVKKPDNTRKAVSTEDKIYTQEEILEFYTSQDVFTDPGEYLSLYNGLPQNTDELPGIVRGLIIHPKVARGYGLVVSHNDKIQVSNRKVKNIIRKLMAIDDKPLHQRRERQDRLPVVSRDYALLLCSFLRYNKIPARVRVGFAVYLSRNYEDQWVCEYWNEMENRWIKIDAFLNEDTVRYFNISFDPLDVPDYALLSSSHVWFQLKEGNLAPKYFGKDELHGFRFVRMNLTWDFLCLNKVTMLPWDDNGIQFLDSILTDEQDSIIDEIAGLCSEPDKNFSKIAGLYKNNESFHIKKDVIDLNE